MFIMGCSLNIVIIRKDSENTLNKMVQNKNMHVLRIILMDYLTDLILLLIPQLKFEYL